MLFLICFSSCQKHHDAPSNKAVDVYVAGITRPLGGNTIASYWKNGSLVTLSNGATSCSANAIAVSGADVYVAGTIFTATGNYVGVYWKNGLMTMLTDSTVNSGANAITISGNDIYIAGFGPNSGAYWKNGSIVNFPTSGNTEITGIAVSGNNVYISGTSGNSNGGVATYWKNGARDTLTSSPLISSAGSIAVNGNDVYVAGTISGFLVNTAVYWKNGVQFNLTNNITTGSATGITLDANNNVYVSGEAESEVNAQTFTDFSMLYWKNGILVDSGATYANNANLDFENIAVTGTDVYVAGAFGDLAAYWKNNSLVQLPGYGGAGYAIALAPH